MTTREESAKKLRSLGVADIFVQSYDAKRLPLNLDIYFGPPEEFFIAPDTQDPYTKGRLIPLLDDGNFGVVTFYDPDAQLFVQKSVESPNESAVVFTSWQQYLADLFIGIVESGADDPELEQIAEIIGFKYMKEAVDFMDAVDIRDWSNRRKVFIASIRP